MQEDHRSTLAPYDADQVPQPHTTDSIHVQDQTMDTGAGTPGQTAIPVQAIPQQLPSYNTLAPSVPAESSAPSSHVGTPTATTNHTTAPPTAPTASPVPKDGKSAAQSEFPIPLPSQAQVHGAPVRQYLNENLSPYLLEVTKHLAAHRPQRPLEFVAEYFMEKSRQIEGTK